MYRVSHFITAYAGFMVAGAVIALVWANLAPMSYHDFIELRLIDGFFIGYPNPDEAGHVTRTLTLQYLVNNVLMAFFFFLAGKEVWEAWVLEHGSFHGRRSVFPLVVTAGGILGPVAVFLALMTARGDGLYEALRLGWAVPIATDLALAYVVGRMIFGAGHPALRILMVLAITDDVAGLMIVAIFHPAGMLQPLWLGLSLAAALGVFLLCNWLPRRLDRGDQLRPRSTWVRRRLSVWPYFAAGAISWYGFQQAGLHPALGLLPIIPAMPHADRAFGIFAEAEEYLSDTLNAAAHLLTWPVAGILFFYGLFNAGAEIAAINVMSWLVLFAFLLGKPLGIIGAGLLAVRWLRLPVPKGFGRRDLVVMGGVAAIGFTVPLFVTSAVLPGGEVQEAAKIGVLGSLIAVPVAVVMARLLGIVRKQA